MSIVYKIHECCKMAALIVASGSVLFFLSCAGDDRTAETHAEDMKTIKVDVENYISGSYDISDMLDTSFFIAAPLQTTPDCLVGDDLKRIFYKNGFIYVLDKMTKGVYIFDVKGSMVGKIRSVGQGPEEYINLDDMYVTDKNVFIWDWMSGKVLVYDTLGRYQNQFRRGKWYGENMFVHDGRVYFIEDMERQSPGYGHYRLTSVDMSGGDLRRYIPFDTVGGGRYPRQVRNIYSVASDGVTIMYPCADTVFKVDKNGVKASYLFDFMGKALPEDIARKKLTARPDGYGKGRIKGMDGMFGTDDYLFFRFEYNTNPKINIKDYPTTPEGIKKLKENRKPTHYVLVYDKHTGKTSVYNSLSAEKIGPLSSSMWIDGGYVVLSVTAPVFKAFYPGTAKHQFDSPYNELCDSISAGLSFDNNPVVLIYKLKN